jgi:hypothetical protein
MSEYDEEFEGQKVEGIDDWGKIGEHEVLCPSGAKVTIRIPDLAAVIESGELPQHLLDAALGVAAKITKGKQQEPTKELIAKEREFTDFLVALTVIKPDLTPDQARRVPYEDKEMIVAIATRQRDMDAGYNHIAGLDRSEKFRRFRRIGEFDPALEG